MLFHIEMNSWCLAQKTNLGQYLVNKIVKLQTNESNEGSPQNSKKWGKKLPQTK